ncbi:hypothetical protein [Clostridium sp. FS41]|uniref:hypothetical protein n=1 Tax=Clostridia TaxID=186801 RepID=UPI0005D42A40|nr:hypothetical protein [Clostridium sp. FS41]KJJ68662.1 hypothetical protein CLFS41_47270 [Clostridium sp. FS41]
MEYEEIMDMIVGELTQRALSRQREEDENLDQLILRQAELRASIERYLAKLDEPDRQIFQEYLELNLEIWGFQEKYLYLQGAKDCVRLLKDLGAL